MRQAFKKSVSFSRISLFKSISPCRTRPDGRLSDYKGYFTPQKTKNQLTVSTTKLGAFWAVWCLIFRSSFNLLCALSERIKKAMEK